ncbi:MAG TPA: HNH endonuclease [Chthonomonadaceae bacterium]|nr:HNH endonuclease [Chthonomonadaceae bacterium]
MSQEYPEEFLELLRSVTRRRPKLVIEHILQHGFVTTEELTTLYGYSHAPRAARDVREEGIPLETIRVKNAEGRTIAAYRFADLTAVISGKLGGRKAFPKKLKGTLLQQDGPRCSVCLTPFEGRYLQVDHRIPYEVGGDPADGRHNPAEYMLLCGSCNRAKSWSCEHCTNWLETKDPDLCRTCYWASPSDYKHIALKVMRRLDITWSEQEVAYYERLKTLAEAAQEEMPDYVKDVLRQHMDAPQRPSR